MTAVLVALDWIGPAFPANAQTGGVAHQSTLYKRLGGFDAIAALTDDLGRVVADPQLGRFFKGHSVDTQKRQRQHVVEFLCAATRGPCFYIGREMRTTHTGLGITEEDWDALMKYLNASLDKLRPRRRRANSFL